MTSADFVALLPLLVTAVSSLVVLLLAAFRREHGLVALATSLGLAAACMTLPVAATVAPRHVTPMLFIDAHALLYAGLILAASLAVTILSFGYLNKHEGQREEFYALLLFATLGAVTLAAATHFASFFLALELLSVSLYVLIAYVRADRRPLEAGIKYLILSGTASAFLLFGMALIYFQSGTMEFARTAAVMADMTALPYTVLVGLMLIVTGVGFKLAVVPFHMWAPDIYQGAPAPVTAFVATVSKGAMVALLLRYFVEIAAFRSESVWWALAGIAAGVDVSLWLLVVLLVINSVIGLFYYLRVIVVMAADGRHDDRRAGEAQMLRVSYTDGLVLATLSGLLFWLGLYPAPLIRLVQTIERGLTG